jgi:hypothetical protein
VIYVIIGRRYLGKTTLARYFAEANPPRLIVDPRAQWPAPIIDPEDENAVGVMDTVDQELVYDELSAGQDVLVQPTDLEFAVAQLAQPARDFITTRKDRKLTIVFDEASLYKEQLRTSWSWMMRCSPMDRTTIILTTHRPADVPTDIRALVDMWCLFRTTQEHDLEVIEERTNPEVRDRVQTLKPYEFISWNDGRAEMRHHKDPASWFTPAAAPLEGDAIEPKRRGLF